MVVNFNSRHASCLRLIYLLTIETNPGPKRVICPVCLCSINDRKEVSVWCIYGGWVHLKCTELENANQRHADFHCAKCSWCSSNCETRATTCPEPSAPANEDLAAAAAPQRQSAHDGSDISGIAEEELAVAAAPPKLTSSHCFSCGLKFKKNQPYICCRKCDNRSQKQERCSKISRYGCLNSWIGPENNGTTEVTKPPPTSDAAKTGDCCS